MISKKMKTLVENGSVIRAMFEEGKRMALLYGKENVYDFSLGNPSIAPPKEVEQAMLAVIKETNPLELHGYMTNAGYEDVRREVAESINQKQGTSFCAENILMTTGAAGGLNVILKTLINPQDEVILFAPFFGEYLNYINNVDGKAVVVQALIPDFLPNLDLFEKQITSRTKAVLINTPNNPSGAVYSEACIKSMTEILERKQKELGKPIYLISDEPYRELVYDGITVPYITKYYANTIICYSFSKSLSIPGERIGYLVMPPSLSGYEDIVQAASVANRILGYVNAPSFMQKVIQYCLYAEVNIAEYNQNRELLYRSLTEFGYICKKPEGAFYLFVKAPKGDDIAFCEQAKEQHILLVPGTTFACSGYVRIAYCVDRTMIERSLPAFQKLINGYAINQ